MIVQAYMKGLHAVFVIFTVLIFIHLCSCLYVQDYGLKQGQSENIEEEEGLQSRRQEQEADPSNGVIEIILLYSLKCCAIHEDKLWGLYSPSEQVPFREVDTPAQAPTIPSCFMSFKSRTSISLAPFNRSKASNRSIGVQ